MERESLLKHKYDPVWFDTLRIVAKRLPKAAAVVYMKIFTESINLDSFESAKLLKASWDSKPLCSNSMRKMIFTIYANRLKIKSMESTKGNL